MIRKRQINNIQILRAIAAIAVVSFHTAASLESNGNPAPIFYLIARKGFSGVDIFFVISGFIMMNSQIINPRKPLEFFLRRLIRIIPMYYFITALYCSIYFIKPELFNTFRFSTSWLLASLTFTSGAASFGDPIILLGWTLEFEILFYCMLAITSKFFKNTNQIIALIVILGLLVLSGINSIVLEFLLGIFCAFISNRLSITPTIAKILVVLGFMTFSLNYMIDVTRLSRVVIFGVPTFFLILGIVNLKPSSNQTAIALGNSSYSTYLVQILTIPLFFKTIHVFHFVNLSGEALGLASILFTVLTGHFLFWRIEKYFDSLIYRRIKFEKERSL